MFPQYGELRRTSGWDRFVSLRHPCKFQRVSRLGSVTARHSSIGRQPNFAALNKGLYSAGRPSRWALAHISSFACHSNIWGTAERIWAKFREDVFGLSFRWVWMSRSNVKGQGHHGQKRALHSHHPWQRRNGMHSLQMTTQQRTAPFRRCPGWFRRFACGLYFV